MKQLPDALTLNNKINNFVNDLIAVSGQDEEALKQISAIRTELVDYVRDSKELVDAQNKRIAELEVKAVAESIFESTKAVLETVDSEVNELVESVYDLKSSLAHVETLLLKAGVQ